jgi:hypothetical protein
MLTIGKGFSSMSSWVIFVASKLEIPDTSQLLWLRGTPFGEPVVPDVQQMVNMSFADGVRSLT